MKLGNKGFLNFFKISWLVIIFVSLFFYLYLNWHEFDVFFNNLSVYRVTLGLAGSFVAKILLLKQMQISINLFGKYPSWNKCGYIFSLSDVSKYIPGGIWATAARSIFYKRLKLKSKQIFMSLAFENAWLLCSGILIASFGLKPMLLLFFKLVLPQYVAVIESFHPFIFVLLGLLVWFFLMQITHYLLLGNFCNFSFLLWNFITQLLIWLGFGLSLWALLPLDINFDIKQYMLITSSIAIAKLAGIAAIFAPGGLGVRELVMGALIDGLNLNDNGYIIALANRALLFLVDISVFLLFLHLNKRIEVRDLENFACTQDVIDFKK